MDSGKHVAGRIWLRRGQVALGQRLQPAGQDE